ncbi:MAG: transglutaminase-like domain-containing protein [Lacunisphaera sp.]|nr:transglutaminase-like domain-containing protein [Lacunisphaera sp.]
MRLPSRKSAPWLALLFAIVLAANLWVCFTRGWEDSFRPKSYATLYYPLDMPSLRRWEVESPKVLRLDLVWNKKPASWQLLVDGKPSAAVIGAVPKLHLVGELYDGSSSVPLDDFKHRYTLRPQPAGSGPDLEFTVNAISAELYRKNGMQWAKDIYLVQTALPTGAFGRDPLSYWTDDYRYMGAEALAAADRVVREEMGVRDGDDTLTRMDKVVRYLRTKLADSGGVPKDDFRWLNPWAMCQEMIAGTGKGWCTQNAQIYVFFANRAGVPTRFVFGANTQDDVIIYTGHSWAESWVKEQGRWTYVDVTQSIVAVQDKHGALLNSADILHLVEHDAFDGTTARIFKDWSWKTLPGEAPPLTTVNVPFAAVNWLARQEFNRQAIIKYRHPPNVEDIRDVYSMLLQDRTFAWVNFKRYLWDPPAAYSLLPTEGAHTYRVRQWLFGALVLAGLLLGVALMRRRD